MRELRIYGASDNLVEFAGAITDEFNVYDPTEFRIQIDEGIDQAVFRVKAEFHDNWTLSVSAHTADSNLPIEFMFDQVPDSYDMDPMLIIYLSDEATVKVRKIG